MGVEGSEVKSLLLQADASVALAQRNLNALWRQVDQQTRQMEGALQRPEDALAGVAAAFASMDQVVVASANQQRAYGTVVDQITAKEMQAVQAIQAVARAMTGLNAPVQIATRQQLEAAAAIGGFAQGVGRLDPALRRGVTSVGQMRAGYQQLSFQIGDVSQQLSLGVSPLTVFAQQAGQTGQAINLMAGGTSAFARFLGGPWFAVITGAITILGTMALGHRNAGAASTDHETAEQTLIRALRGEEDAIRKVNEAIAEQLHQSSAAIETTNARARAAERSAAKHLGEAQQIREVLKAELARQLSAQQTLVAAMSVPSAEGAGATSAAYQEARRRAAELTQQIAAQDIAIAQATQGLVNTRIPLVQREVEASMDAAAAATLRYERALDRLQHRAAHMTVGEYGRAYSQIVRERDRAIEAAREAEREARRGTDGDMTSFIAPVPGRPAHPFGERRSGRRPGYTHPGVDLPVPVGSQVHAAAGGTVIEVGNVPGYGNVVVIDHGRGTTTRYGHLSQMLVQRGQRIDQGDVIALSGGRRGAPGAGNSTGPHLHYEVRRGGRPVNPMTGRYPTDALASGQNAERLALQQERNEESFRQDLARANEELLRARNELVVSADQQVDFELAQVESERQRARSANQADVTQGRRSQAEADQLNLVLDGIATQKAANIRARAAEQAAQNRLAVAQAELRGEAEIEQLRGRLAETTRARRDSQIRLLDMSQEQERNEIERTLASTQAKDWEKEIAATRRRQLDIIRGMTIEGINRENEGPRARYMRELRTSVANVDEQLEELDVRAMRELDRATQDAIKSMLGLHGALGDIVSDLIQMFFRQQVLLPLFEMMNGKGSSGGGGGGGFGGIFSQLAGLFGGGGGSVQSSSWDQVLSTVGSLPLEGKAAGGPISAGKPYMVGERGPEIIVPRVPSVVIPNGAGFGGRRVNYFDMRGAVVTQELLGQINQAMAATGQEAAVLGTAGALRTQARRADRALPTGF